MHPGWPRFAVTTRLLCAWVVLACPPAYGQDAPPGPLPKPDFLLKPPVWFIEVRGGWLVPRAGSDLFEFLHETLTIDKRDFRTDTGAASVGFSINSRVDVLFGVEEADTSIQSEYRDWVDNDLLPIEQTTELKTVHLVGELRYALLPRGHAVGKLAWVPRTVAPYVGIGAGAVRYELSQTGDFVDFVDNSVFSDVFSSEGWTPTVHAFGGVQLHVYRRLFATVELRYVWADTELDPDFVDFEPIDLAGARTSAGIAIVF